MAQSPDTHVNRELLVKAMVYGVPGSGKTTFAASAMNHPDMAQVLFISVEGGMLSVPQSPNVKYEEIRNTGGRNAIEQVEAYFWDLAANKSGWTKDVKTVVIDSATELLTLTIEGIVSKRNGTIDEIYMNDYGKSTASLKRLFRYFRDLPINVIVTALAQDVIEGKGEAAIKVAVEPMFTAKLRESVKGVFDHVWYIYKSWDKGGDVETYSLLTRSKGMFYAKTRGTNFAPALGLKVDNPTLPAIYNLLLKSEGKKNV